MYHHLTILFFDWYKQVQQMQCITTLPSTFCLVQASAASALYHNLTILIFDWYKQVQCITTLPSTFCLVQGSAANALYHHLTIHFLLGTSKCSKCIVSPPYHPLFAWYKQVQQVHCITTVPSTFCLVQASAASTLYHRLTIYFLLGTSKCNKCIVSTSYNPLFAWYKQVHCITTLPPTKCSKCIVSLPFHLLFAWYKQVQQVQCITTLPSTVCSVQASAASALYHHLTIHFLLGTSKCNVSTP